MIVLDTHVLLWWVAGETDRLTPAAIQAIEAELNTGQLVISSISAWEIAMLVAKGRLMLSMDAQDWITVVEQIPAVRFQPVDNGIAIHSASLPGSFHKDPADRIIVATARRLAATLLSADEKIRAYPHVRVLW